MNNFAQRTLTGGVFVAVIVMVIFSGSGALGVLFVALSVVGFLEYASILAKGGLARPARLRGAVVTVLVHHVFWQAFALDRPKYLLVIIPLVAFTAVIDLFVEPEKGFERMKNTLFGHLWITLPFAAVTALGSSTGTYEPWVVMGFFTLLWINDTGAYLAGRALGRTKLAPLLSPGKTVEGFIGGVVLAFSGAWLISAFAFELSRFSWLVMAGVIAVFSNAGDLSESALKRRCGVKDSGNLLPGHGGVLDRFDGILLSVPVIVAYLLFVNL